MPDTELTFYEILDVLPTASLTEIKDAYRKKAWQYHPDVNPNDNHILYHQMMCMINEAYATLRNIETRMEYDKTLRETGKYPSIKAMYLEGEVETSQPNRYTNFEDDYEIYQYYNSRDYNYYEQEEFLGWVTRFYECCYERLYNINNDYLSKKDLTWLEKLVFLFEKIINFEKVKGQKRTKANRL